MPVLLTRQCFPLNINRLSESSVFLPGSAWLLAVTPWGVAEQGRLTCETMPAFYLVSLLGLISQCMWKKKQQIFPNSQVGNCIGSTPAIGFLSWRLLQYCLHSRIGTVRNPAKAQVPLRRHQAASSLGVSVVFKFKNSCLHIAILKAV